MEAGGKQGAGRYMRLALSKYWNNVPRDRDIPFIGLSFSAQDKVRRWATLFMLDEEPKELRRKMAKPSAFFEVMQK